jgi:hypothetical protein
MIADMSGQRRSVLQTSGTLCVDSGWSASEDLAKQTPLPPPSEFARQHHALFREVHFNVEFIDRTPARWLCNGKRCTDWFLFPYAGSRKTEARCEQGANVPYVGHAAFTGRSKNGFRFTTISNRYC